MFPAGLVIALHCSGAGAGQWRSLGELLGSEFPLAAPEHYGCDRSGSWSGTHAFSLADEAVRTIELIDRGMERIHLVGHSYGGGVALHVALMRPHRIASLSLYEPSAFHLLRQMGDRGRDGFAEIAAVARATGECILCGDHAAAAKLFVDYWGGRGAWATMRPSVQSDLIRWAPKAPLDFRALIEEPTAIEAYSQLRMPTLVIRGEHAPLPTGALAEELPSLMPCVRTSVIPGAGHMGPMTHVSAVNELIAAHIRTSAAADRVSESAQPASNVPDGDGLRANPIAATGRNYDMASRSVPSALAASGHGERQSDAGRDRADRYGSCNA
ncbi:MAG: alpha/beta fold hydrolase [Rhizobiaceae bacterium]|nr:alpha/beta fold hydrolase [Rhizobiaceae bacterium]